MRLYTVTVLDLFTGDFITSAVFQTPYPIDMDMVDYVELLFALGLNYSLDDVEVFITDNGFVSTLPVVEF